MTERELFEEWFNNVYDVDGSASQYKYDFSWEVWQAATNREGFKLVPVVTESHINEAYRLNNLG